MEPRCGAVLCPNPRPTGRPPSTGAEKSPTQVDMLGTLRPPRRVAPLGPPSRLAARRGFLKGAEIEPHDPVGLT